MVDMQSATAEIRRSEIFDNLELPSKSFTSHKPFQCNLSYSYAVLEHFLFGIATFLSLYLFWHQKTRVTIQRWLFDDRFSGISTIPVRDRTAISLSWSA